MLVFFQIRKIDGADICFHVMCDHFDGSFEKILDADAVAKQMIQFAYITK